LPQKETILLCYFNTHFLLPIDKFFWCDLLFILTCWSPLPVLSSVELLYPLVWKLVPVAVPGRNFQLNFPMNVALQILITQAGLYKNWLANIINSEPFTIKRDSLDFTWGKQHKSVRSTFFPKLLLAHLSAIWLPFFNTCWKTVTFTSVFL